MQKNVKISKIVRKETNKDKCLKVKIHKKLRCQTIGIKSWDCKNNVRLKKKKYTDDNQPPPPPPKKKHYAYKKVCRYFLLHTNILI